MLRKLWFSLEFFLSKPLSALKEAKNNVTIHISELIKV